MVTISHLVKKYVNERPFLQEAVSRGIINYANLADEMTDYIEKELKKKVKQMAVVMALRRYSEELGKKEPKKLEFNFHSQIVMKTDIIDIAVIKSPGLFKKLERLYGAIDYERGDTLNVIHGSKEVAIIAPRAHKKDVFRIIGKQEIFNIEEGLVSLSLTFSKEFLYTPGVIARVLRHLAWENVNVYEVVSTNTELTIIIHKDDSVRAYEKLQQLIEGYKPKKQ